MEEGDETMEEERDEPARARSCRTSQQEIPITHGSEIPGFSLGHRHLLPIGGVLTKSSRRGHKGIRP